MTCIEKHLIDILNAMIRNIDRYMNIRKTG
jgi:hypothetical protein